MKLNSALSLLKQIGAVAGQHNLKAWAVGGFARDYYLNRATKDIDICVEGNPAPLIDFCKKQHNAKAEYFKEFGTARLTFANGIKLDFVRCRKEVYPKPAALPVVSPSVLSDDLFRRDFTANAWALSLLPQEFLKSYDLYGSKKAIDQKYIAVLHHASFEDDPTRLFRAVRFAARFGWKIEKDTEQLIKQAVKAGLPNLLSRERIRQELLKILQEESAQDCFELLKKYKLISFIYPSLKSAPKNLDKAKTPLARLALLSLSVKEGEDFAKSLHLARQDFGAIKNILDIYHSTFAPHRALVKEEKEIIKIAAPKLLPRLKPAVLSGGDLAAAGLKGATIKQGWEIAAKLQREGKIKTKAQALAVLKTKKII